MKLSAPTKNVFYISVVLAVLGILGGLGWVAALSAYGVYLLIAAYVLLYFGNTLKGF